MLAASSRPRRRGRRESIGDERLRRSARLPFLLGRGIDLGPHEVIGHRLIQEPKARIAHELLQKHILVTLAQAVLYCGGGLAVVSPPFPAIGAVLFGTALARFRSSIGSMA